jgi:hypothetical protein
MEHQKLWIRWRRITYLRTLLELVLVCHHSNACNDGVRARTLVFFYLFFFGFTLNLFL